MMIRQALGTMALMAMLGIVPPSVGAANPDIPVEGAPVRFAVVKPTDNPKFIEIGRRGHKNYRKIVVPQNKKIIWRYM